MAERRRGVSPERDELLRAERRYGGRGPEGPLSVALCYPNRYSIGMANLGFQTVLDRLDVHPACRVERVFHDDGAGTLVSFESGKPAGGFDVLAFSVSFENDYVNLLRMLRRARLPLRREERSERHPLVVVGGAITFLNPEPLRPFADVFLMGEGEEMIGEFVDYLAGARHGERRSRIEGAVSVGGAYIPAIHPACGEVTPRTYDAVRSDPAVSRIVTPHSEFKETLLMEISRGCPRRCRFCTVGSAMPKFRMLGAGAALKTAERFRDEDRSAGRQPLRKVGLVSAAFFDHKESAEIASRLFDRGFEIGVSSLRVDQLTDEVLAILRRSGLRTITVAPEAGTERLRKLIRKEASDEVILAGVEKAARAGFRSLRIYYMIGLPFEEEGDIDGLVEGALAMRARFLDVASGPVRVSVSLHPFVPKPRTPFQWSAMIEPAKLKRMTWKIRRRLPGLRVRTVARRECYTEGVLARGGEELAPFL